MSNKKNKHKGESVIGKIIYGFLLFLPLFAIGVTCLVNVFNNTEQQETTINYKYETNEVNSISDVNLHTHIYKVSKSFNVFNADKLIQRDMFNTLITFEAKNQNSYLGVNSSQINYIYNGTSQGYNSMQISLNDYYAVFYDFTNINNNSIQYISKVPEEEMANLGIESIETHGINRNDTFYKSIEQVENSNLFNWSKNSIIYTGTNEFAQAMNITNTFIPMLLAYWLIISVVYFVYDIVLMLVLIVHTKIHELQDSL